MVICVATKRAAESINFAELLSDYDSETSNLIDDNYDDVYSESNNDQHAQHLKLQLELLQRQQRERLDIFVEVLLVTDYSIFEMHKSIILSSKWNLTQLDDELVENHIRAYYTQIIDDVIKSFKLSRLGLWFLCFNSFDS